MIEIPSIHHDMSHAEYHALEGYVSNSYLSRLNICPAAAKVKQEETEAMMIGTAFHSFVLDGMTAFSRDVAVLPDINRRTNAGKEEYAAFLAANEGKAIITADDLKSITEMDKAIKSHPFARNIIAEGSNEVSIFWEDPFSGLLCKARPDKTPGKKVLVDLKSVKDASPGGFLKSVFSYGYARQAAMYLDGMNKATGEDYDIFAFIVVEKKEPFKTAVYTLSPALIEYGRNDYHRLMMVEIHCREKETWPSYTDGEAIELELPKWAAMGV